MFVNPGFEGLKIVSARIEFTKISEIALNKCSSAINKQAPHTYVKRFFSALTLNKSKCRSTLENVQNVLGPAVLNIVL